MWTKVSMVEGGQKDKKKKSVELGHWEAVKASDSNRDTAISPGAVGLMENDTCSVLSTWSGPGTSGRGSEKLPPAPTVLFHSPSPYCGFQTSILRALLGSRRYNFLSLSDFRHLPCKSKTTKTYQKCPQRTGLWKHLLKTQHTMLLKMEKHKILPPTSKESGKLWNQEKEWKTNRLQIVGFWSCFQTHRPSIFQKIN